MGDCKSSRVKHQTFWLVAGSLKVVRNVVVIANGKGVERS